MKRLRDMRPSPALVVSFVALFVAMAGTAMALEANSVGSKQIKDESVKSQDVAENALTAADLQNQSVDHAELAPDAVLDWHIQDNAIHAQEILAGSVHSSELTSVQMRSGELTAISDGDGGDEDWSGGEATAECEEDEQILSAFGQWSDASGGNDTAIAEQSMNMVTRVHSVTIRGIQNTGTTKHLRAIAVCLGA